ncbi:3023_t:CDS:2 [Entrophospora sp. SA101]|nr:3023_t:CDS:2 [Entrophospora sp. SA101]
MDQLGNPNSLLDNKNNDNNNVVTTNTSIQKNRFPSLASLSKDQKALISITGSHGTDIIGCVLECMAKHDYVIEDFNLSRLYHKVTYSVLITLKRENAEELFNDVSDAAKKWDASLAIDLQNFAGDQDKPPISLEDAPYVNRVKYAATILNQNGLATKFMNEWTKLLLREKISVEKMQRLNEGRMLTCADYKLSIPLETDFDKLRRDLFQLSRSYYTDVALQPYDIFRRHKRLVVFDMDSTLIEQEVIDEIARLAGVVNDVAESLKRRVLLLKGTSVDVIEIVKKNLTSELGLDYAFANELKVSPDGLTLTGETIGPIIDGQRKAELLEVIAQAEGVALNQVIAIGDGANDLWMLSKAGLGIAFNAKPRVQEKASTRINQRSLKYVLYLLGYTDEDAKQLYSTDN